MMADTRRANWPKVANRVPALNRYAWIAGVLLARAHYLLTIIVGPVFGWR